MLRTNIFTEEISEVKVIINKLLKEALEKGIVDFNNLWDIGRGSKWIGEELKKDWENQYQTVLQSQKEITTYHTCPLKNKDSILEYGIWHDFLPTLTSSLLGALLKAEEYNSYRDKEHIILKVYTNIDVIEFLGIKQMGPGFLPRDRKEEEESLEVPLNPFIRQRFFGPGKPKEAAWLNPEYIQGEIYRTGKNSYLELLKGIYPNPAIESAA